MSIVIYPIYSDYLIPYHACPKNWKMSFDYLLIFPKNLDECQTVDAAEGGVWSGTTLFAQTCLSEYIG